MLQDGVNFLDGSTAENFQIQSGTTLPTVGLNTGELFYLTSGSIGLYVYTGSAWETAAGGTTVASPLNEVVYGSGSGVTSSSKIAVDFTPENDSTAAQLKIYDNAEAMLSVKIAQGSEVMLRSLDGGSASIEFSAPTGTATIRAKTASTSVLLATLDTNAVVAGNIDITAGASDASTAGSINLAAGAVTSSGAAGTVNITAGAASGGPTGGALVLSSGGASFGSTVSGAIIIRTGTTERLRVTSTGALSIGNTGTAYGTSGQILTSNGNAAPTWQTAGAASSATNIAGGANNQVPYQTGAGVTAFSNDLKFDYSNKRLEVSGGMIIGGGPQDAVLNMVSTGAGVGKQLTINGSGANGSTGGIISINGGSTNASGVAGGLVTISGGSNNVAGGIGGALQLKGGEGAATQGAIQLFSGSTERFRITTTGALSTGNTGTAYGTSGQVLTSNGNTVPTWQAVSVPADTTLFATTTPTLSSATANVSIGVTNSAPSVVFNRIVGVATDNKVNYISTEAAGAIYWRFVNDAFTTSVPWMIISRSGNTASNINFISTALTLNIAGSNGTNGQVLTSNGTSASWAANANQTITLSGDATGSGTTAITVALATVNGNVGSFGLAGSVPTFTVNAKGLITAASNTAISISEGQILDGNIFPRLASNESISGDWSFTMPVVGVSPAAASHFATKDYVDNVAAGLSFKSSVRATTTGNITLSGTQTIDGVSVVAGNRVLVKNQTTGSQNGIYTVAAGAWSRTADFDGTPASEVASGAYMFVREGTLNSNTGWVLATPDPITLDTTSLSFTQFTGLGAIDAGAGLSITGSQINIGTASASRIVVNVDDIDLALAGTAGTYKSVTTDAYGRVTAGTNPTTLAGFGITDAVLKAGDTMSGTLTSITPEGVRLARDSGFISGYNDANTVQTGFLQFSTTNGVTLSTDVALPLKLNTNNLERIRILSDGKVGIGTTTPAFALQVGNGTGTGNFYSRVFSTSADLYFGQAAGTIFGLTTGTGGIIAQAAAFPLGIGTTLAQPLILGTNSLERLRIDPNGILTMTTSTVTAFSHKFTNTSTGTGALAALYTGNSASISNQTAFATFGTNYTTNGHYDANRGIIETGSALTNGLVLSTLAGPMIFSTAGFANNERMRITATGGVSFGTSGTAVGASGQILSSTGDAPPTWVTPTTQAAKESSTAIATTAFVDRLRSLLTGATSGTLTVTDRGALCSLSTGPTIPASVFAANDVVTLYNNTGAAMTITQGSGLTLRLVGTATTGNRSLPQRGLATLVFITATEAVISGAE